MTMLLDAGADPAVRDEDGKLPFDKIQADVGEVLRIQAAGMVFPSQGNRLGNNIGGSLQTDFYWKLNQARIEYRYRSPNATPARQTMTSPCLV